MRQLLRWIKRYGLIVPLLIIVVAAAGGLAYLAGLLSVWPGASNPVASPLSLTTVPPLPGTPVARFAQVDPALLDVVDYGQSHYGALPLDFIGAGIPPVGAYLPRSGNMQFELVGPTPLPTPLPYATSPPLPLPPVPEQILPTISPDAINDVAQTFPYGGDECAPSGLPVDGILTQRYHAYHGGIDLAAPVNTGVVATHSGKVTFADWSDVGYGYLVIIQNGSFITYYAHNTSFNVEVNQIVGKGAIIAWSGSTGNSTGPHIHYEIRINDVTVDPLTFEDRGYASC